MWPIPKELDSIYKKDYFKAGSEKTEFGYTDYDLDKEPMKKIFTDFLIGIENFVKKKTIFDVGVATGYFLDIAINRGWQTAGVEISQYASKLARSKGHEVSTGDLESIDVQAKFDLITMWDVLEHLSNPKLSLKKANQMLVKAGLLIINTIDKNSFWARLWGKKWHLIIPPEHLYYFSFKNLEILLKDTGFKILITKKIVKKFSLSYICRVLYHKLNFRILYFLSRFFNTSLWRKISLPINLRDNIYIIAKKSE